MLKQAEKTLREKVVNRPDRHQIIAKLVAYGSNVAHSSVERAGMLGGVKVKAHNIGNNARFFD